MNGRRKVLLALGSSALVLPFRSLAQQAKPWRIGFLGLAPASGWASEIEALKVGLRDLGYLEGKNVLIEFRWAAKVEQFPELAAELVRMKVDVIVAPASTQVEPARQATRTIPIVFAQHADPVGTGHVASLGRPGGNITGVSMVLTEIAAKALELLREVLPDAARLGVLWNPTTPTHPYVLKAVESVARKLNVELVSVPVQSVNDFEGAFSTLMRERAGGFLVPTSPLTNSQPAPLAALALRHRLPGMFGNRANVAAGGLMSYGADFNYMYRRTAFYVDKILKGATPAELPVERASKYYLVINRTTANAIGIAIPQSIVLRTDEVIG
jgi:putative tryptophan/tyrosine transport system substrate-binding protein